MISASIKTVTGAFGSSIYGEPSERAQIAAKTLLKELERGWLTSLISSRLSITFYK